MIRSSTEQIKILRVIARLNVGGPAIHTILLSSRMNQGEFQTKLVSGTEDKSEGNMYYLAEEKGVNIHQVAALQREISLFKEIQALFKMVRLIRQYKPDIIHTHTAKAGLIGRMAVLLLRLVRSRNAKVKVVHTFHGHVFHSYFSPLKTKVFLNLERVLGRMSDLIITITPGQQRELLDLGIGKEDNHKMIPLGLELERFYVQPRFTGWLRKTFSLPTDKHLIGTVARLVSVKNLTVFLDMAKRLLDQRSDVHFVLVGDGDQRKLLENHAQKLGISHAVTFTGFCQELPLIYSDLSVMVLTSLNEGSPVSIIEAMSAGVPVVASRVGGVPDLFTSETAQFLCDPNDSVAFADHVNFLLNNPLTASRQAESQKERIYKQYHFDRLVDDLTQAYQELVKPVSKQLV